ncbi:MAG: DNA recombination protein RmuC [Fimbriimonadaceae bacterium]|nr:DNA recombination protein RmuC [Fimbriimonadaceae bacterium]
MDPSVAAIIGVVLGLFLGGAGVFALLRSRLGAAESDAQVAREELSANRVETARLQEKVGGLESVHSEVASVRGLLEEKSAALSKAQQEIARHETAIAERDQSYADREKQIREVFDSLSREALSQNTKDLIHQNEQLLKKIKEQTDQEDFERRRHIQTTLDPFEKRLKELEQLNRDLDQKRVEDASSLGENLKAITVMQQRIEIETNRLVKSLQNPGQAGAWGEMVLEQVLEMGGLKKGINYHLQVHEQGADSSHRPDAIVDLPGGRQIAIDSKSPMSAYLDAQNVDVDQAQREKLHGTFTTHLFKHCNDLAKKSYTEKDSRLDMVFLFIPSEGAYRAALEARPSLIEDAFNLQVIIASPSTLLVFLRAVSFGWRQEELSKNAEEIQKQAGLIYETLGVMAERISALGKSLNKAGHAHNNLLATFNGNLLPKSRRMNELGMQGKKRDAIEEVEGVHLELTEPKAEALALASPMSKSSSMFEDEAKETAEEEATPPTVES